MKKKINQILRKGKDVGRLVRTGTFNPPTAIALGFALPKRRLASCDPGIIKPQTLEYFLRNSERCNLR